MNYMGNMDWLYNNSVSSAGGSIGNSAVALPTTIAPSPNNANGVAGAFEGVGVSFFNGISTILGGLAATAVAPAPGSAVAYDAYGAPIRQYYGSNGAPFTGSTSVWPGAPGGPSAFPERVMQSASPTQGPWGWLTNLAGLPAPKPDAALGAVSGVRLDQYGLPRTGIPPWLVVVGLGLVGLVAVKVVLK